MKSRHKRARRQRRRSIRQRKIVGVASYVRGDVVAVGYDELVRFSAMAEREGT